MSSKSRICISKTKLVVSCVIVILLAITYVFSYLLNSSPVSTSSQAKVSTKETMKQSGVKRFNLSLKDLSPQSITYNNRFSVGDNQGTVGEDRCEKVISGLIPLPTPASNIPNFKEDTCYFATYNYYFETLCDWRCSKYGGSCHAIQDTNRKSICCYPLGRAETPLEEKIETFIGTLFTTYRTALQDKGNNKTIVMLENPVPLSMVSVKLANATAITQQTAAAGGSAAGAEVVTGFIIAGYSISGGTVGSIEGIPQRVVEGAPAIYYLDENGKLIIYNPSQLEEIYVRRGFPIRIIRDEITGQNIAQFQSKDGNFVIGPDGNIYVVANNTTTSTTEITLGTQVIAQINSSTAAQGVLAQQEELKKQQMKGTPSLPSVTPVDQKNRGVKTVQNRLSESQLEEVYQKLVEITNRSGGSPQPMSIKIGTEQPTTIDYYNMTGETPINGPQLKEFIDYLTSNYQTSNGQPIRVTLHAGPGNTIDPFLQAEPGEIVIAIDMSTPGSAEGQRDARGNEITYFGNPRRDKEILYPYTTQPYNNYVKNQQTNGGTALFFKVEDWNKMPELNGTFKEIFAVASADYSNAEIINSTRPIQNLSNFLGSKGKAVFIWHSKNIPSPYYQDVLPQPLKSLVEGVVIDPNTIPDTRTLTWDSTNPQPIFLGSFYRPSDSRLVKLSLLRIEGYDRLTKSYFPTNSGFISPRDLYYWLFILEKP